jgi:hypothetical protein
MDRSGLRKNLSGDVGSGVEEKAVGAVAVDEDAVDDGAAVAQLEFDGAEEGSGRDEQGGGERGAEDSGGGGRI